MGERISRWSRREVYIGQSLEEFNRIRDVLDANQIKHAYRQVGGGTVLGMSNITYYIYVHEGDEEAANFLIRRR